MRDFLECKIQLRCAVMAAIKVIRVIPDTYIGQSSFRFATAGGCPLTAKIIETLSPLIVGQRRKNRGSGRFLSKILRSLVTPCLHPFYIFGIIHFNASEDFFLRPFNPVREGFFLARRKISLPVTIKIFFNLIDEWLFLN